MGINNTAALDLLYILDLSGTLVFAISGAFVAADRQMDIFGALILSFVTAVGGGTLRDVLIGSTPVGWMQDINYVIAILAGYLLAVFMGRPIQRLNRTLFLFDAIGIGLFTILGLEKTLNLGLSPIVGVLMGAVSATFGGVIRDVLAGRVPLILREEIYATACVAGGLIYLLLATTGMSIDWVQGLSVAFIILLRMLAVRFHLALPKISQA